MHVQFVVPFLKDSERTYARRLPIVVGRSSEAKFRIPLDSVSRRHCEIFEKDGAVFVRDLGSTNGTLLDGELVAVAIPTRVRPGGMIQVGGVAIRIEYEPAGPAADGPGEIRVTRLTPTEPAAAALAATGSQPDITDVVDPQAGAAGADAVRAGAVDVRDVAGTDGEDSASPGCSVSAPGDEGGFSFLGAAVAEVPPDDENLGDFFKSLA